jgi:DUF1365 family protein
MMFGSAIYAGEVVHVRMRPVVHKLSYRVFSLLLDVDEIDAAAARCRLFKRNRAAVVSFHDRDHGAGDGADVATHARATFDKAGLPAAGHRVLLLAYPRILGYAFNPLSVFYGFDAEGRLAGVIYEVNNTFRERTSYVVAAGTRENGTFHQACDKQMYVSPFTPPAARYGFRLTEPADALLVGVHLHDAGGALLRTHFHGVRLPLDDRHLLRQLLRLPLMTLKVIGAIHLEALRLYLKGVPVVRRDPSPRYRVSNVATPPPPPRR